MQQSPLLLWRFVLMLIRIRRSKDLLEQFQEFECSSLFAFNHCLYWTTRYNTCGRIGTKWLFFFTFIEECCVVMEKNIGKKLPNRISDQVWYKRWLKERLVGGPNLRRGGPNRCDTGILETPKDIDEFTICPTHRRCRVPKKVSGHGKSRVKSIPKADRGIGKRVPQMVRKTSGKFI